MNVDAKQRYLMVAEAAYFRAELRNFAPGHEHDDWLAAERQVDEMLKNLAAVPMQAELRAQAEAKPSSKQVRKQPAKAAAPKITATTEAKPARKRQAKEALATEVKPARTRRTKAATAQAARSAGTAGISGVGAGIEAEVTQKKGRRTKAAVAESATPAKRPGRPRKTTLH